MTGAIENFRYVEISERPTSMSPRPFHLQWQIGSVTPHGERNIPDHGEKHCGRYQVDMKKDLVTWSCHETVNSCACGASLSCHSS